MNPARPDAPRDATLPIVEEQVRIGRRVEETGAVRVRIESEVVQAESTLDAAADEVEVRRVPVNAVVEARREPWLEDGAIVVPVYEEVIERRLVLREEIRLVRCRALTPQRVAVPLRRERAIVERRRPDGTWQPVEPTAAAGPGTADAGREPDEPKFDVPSSHRSDP